MARVKLGDIFEIKTSKGYAYFHYVYKDNQLGQLIKVLTKIYDQRPASFNDLITNNNECFLLFFPVSAALKNNIIEKADNYVVSNFKKPKQMRTEHHIKGEFLGWDIIDTDTWKRKFTKKLSRSQKKLSPWGIWNDTLLIERLEEGWNLENWC